MLAEIDGIQKLDYAINAALLLAYVATLSEDRVGLLLFRRRSADLSTAEKRTRQVYAIMEALYNAKATFAEPDYRKALGTFAHDGGSARWSSVSPTCGTRTLRVRPLTSLPLSSRATWSRPSRC